MSQLQQDYRCDPGNPLYPILEPHQYKEHRIRFCPVILIFPLLLGWSHSPPSLALVPRVQLGYGIAGSGHAQGFSWHSPTEGTGVHKHLTGVCGCGAASSDG